MTARHPFITYTVWITGVLFALALFVSLLGFEGVWPFMAMFWVFMMLLYIPSMLIADTSNYIAGAARSAFGANGQYLTQLRADNLREDQARRIYGDLEVDRFLVYGDADFYLRAYGEDALREQYQAILSGLTWTAYDHHPNHEE